MQDVVVLCVLIKIPLMYFELPITFLSTYRVLFYYIKFKVCVSYITCNEWTHFHEKNKEQFKRSLRRENCKSQFC